MYDRILKLINEEQLKKIKEAKILLIGIGGVGGYVLESLIRSGLKNITVIDEDIIEESNLNRQILATRTNLQKPKVECAKERGSEITEDCVITPIYKRLTEEEINLELVNPYDYIIDACDTVSVKIALIRLCTKEKKKLISSMGTANKLHPEMLEIKNLKDTSADPLARVLRSTFKNEKECLKTKVVCSKEIPKKQKELGTLVPVPMAAGALLASYVINDLIS